MITVYFCSKCFRAFSTIDKAKLCEISHSTNDNYKLAQLINFHGFDPCDYCKYAYWVYGCERDCEKKECKDYNLFEKKKD